MAMTVQPHYADHDGSIDIEPFARTNWKVVDARNGLAEPLRRAAEGKQRAEWLSVHNGDARRRAAIIHVTNTNRERWIRRCQERDLVYRDIRYSEPYDGFAHEFSPTTLDNPNRITYSVVAQNEDIADKMVEAETEMQGEERHRTVGELLGFPDCCLDFFAEHWLGEDSKRDPIYEITCNSGNAECIDGDHENIRVVDPNPGASILWKYFGWAFVTHIPCSWDCEDSIDIARTRYEIMAEDGYEDAASVLSEFLREPAVWSGYHAIAEVRNRHCIGTAQTSDYWSEKRVVWGEEHEPR